MNQIPNIEETNSREWEDQFNSLWKSTSAWNLHPHDSQPVIEFIHHQLQKARHDIHTSLVAAAEGKKATSYDERNMSTDETAAYNQAIYDTLTIINSIFKE